MLIALALLATGLLAFANGANDNAKPIATLVGSRLASPRAALRWGTLATLLGSLAAIVLGRALIASFSAKGLVGADVAQTLPFIAATTCGAAATVLTATRFGLPISTTHSLIGAIIGAGTVLSAVDYGVLLAVFVVPLLVSPLLAMAATGAIYPLAHRTRRALGITRDSCVCVGTRWVPVGNAVAMQAQVTAGQTPECAERYVGSVAGVRAGSVATGLHWASALSLSFGRGLQDGAKIAGLAVLVVGASFNLTTAAGIAVLMAAGGLFAARRVEETMANRVSTMNDGQGLLANFVATALVFAATAFGAPVSTTHVTTGALIGLRSHTDAPRASWLGRILLAWVITLPMAAAIAAGVAWMVSS